MRVQSPIKHHVCKKNFVWNPSTCACEINRHLKSIADDFFITSIEVIDALAK